MYARGVEIVSSRMYKDGINIKNFYLLMELIKDYNLEVQYHPGKSNVVADSLFRKQQFNYLRAKAMGITIYHKMEMMNLEIIQMEVCPK